MEKTKLGLSLSAMGALVFTASLFGGYTVALLVVGYILICENNIWLKRSGVKAIVLLVSFSLISTLLGLIPDLFQLVYSLLNIFEVHVYVDVIDRIMSFLYQILSLAKTVLFLLLTYKALKQQTLVIPPVDNLITKFMN